MKLFLIIIVLAFIVFAATMYLAWHFLLRIDRNYSNYNEPNYHEYYKYNKYHEDEEYYDEWWH